MAIECGSGTVVTDVTRSPVLPYARARARMKVMGLIGNIGNIGNSKPLMALLGRGAR
jgi:hypothetical protein